MQTLCVTGADAASVVGELAGRLSGRVATVDRTAAVDPDRTIAVDHDSTAVVVGDDGSWVARGTDRSVMDVLDSLAPVHDYALVAGFAHHRLPTVVVGDRVDVRYGVSGNVDGAAASEDSTDAADLDRANVVATADTAADLDFDALADRLDDFEPHVTLETLVERVKRSAGAERSGAIATFTGRVRVKDSPDDDRTERLTFEKYAGVAADRLASIRAELRAREGVFDVRMHHRVGTMTAGEDIVFVVVLAGHRAEAFRTVEDGIDRLKDEVPIFKKETTESETFWLHEV